MQRHDADRLGRAIVVGLSLVLSGATALSAPAASAADLAPLNVPASTEHHPGKIVFAELVTPDIAAAKQFYGSLFGWSFQDFEQSQGSFTQASLDGQVVAGMFQRPLPTGRRPNWISFIATSDLDASEGLAVQAGAKVLLPPHQLAELGREAVFTDPQGGVFAMLQSTSGDPPDLLADPGDWIWSSLITTDPTKAVTFYKTVFGYDLFNMSTPQDPATAQHMLMASDNFARASVNSIPSSWVGARPRWLDYIRVDDATAMAAKATSLGGKVVLSPRVDRHGGKIAILADPQGALFGVMEWPTDAPAGNAK
ncbi:VOC family protein [Lichenicola sp.]|uniref:VOC family protein n=1 Tax=Lichenicola sp. TaxID=2804529 RepID=UPI003B003C1C